MNLMHALSRHRRRTVERSRVRDRGSALPMVLVFMVISAFVVLPLMTFAMSVINANTVLSAKAQRFESVKAGLRTVLYDPLAVYRECDSVFAVDEDGEGDQKSLDDLFPLEINGHQVHTTCSLIGLQKTAVDDHLRYGLVTTKVGETVPPELKGKKYPGGTLATDWTAITTHNFEDTDDVDVTDKIWLPTLPTYPVTVRDPDAVLHLVASGRPQHRKDTRRAAVRGALGTPQFAGIRRDVCLADGVAPIGDRLQKGGAARVGH